MITVAPTESASGSRVAFLGWLGFTLLLFYALVVGGGWLGMYVAPFRLFNLAIVVTGLVGWLVVAWRRPEWRPTTAIWPALVAPLVAFGLSLTFSQQQRIGFDFMAYAVLLTALYLLLVRILALPYARARIGGVMAAIAFVLMSAYIGWSMLLWMEWWGLVGELRVPPLRPALLGMTWGSPSVVFTVLTLTVTAAIGGLGLRTRGPRVVAAVLVAMLLAAALISGSRSGWLALAGAVIVTGGLALLDARGRDLLARAWRTRAFRLVLVPCVLLAGLAIVLLGPTLLNRLGSGDAGRLELWASALRMFEDAPLLGFGPGSWMVRRVAYQEAGELNWYQPHAHSQYFQTAAELGLVGLAAGVVAFGAVGWLLYRALRGRDTERRRWAWASVFGLSYLAVNVLVDTHTIPTVALLMGLPIAVLDATSDQGLGLPMVPRRVACWLRNLAAVLLMLACAAGVQQLLRSEAVAMDHALANTAASEGAWADARAGALGAAAANPEIGAYGMTAATVLASEGDWAAAEQAYRGVIAADELPDAWLGLARALVEQGEAREVVAHALEEALRLGEQEPAVLFAAARVYDLAGMEPEADAVYAETLAAVPSLAADETWRTDLGSERVARIVDAAMGNDPGQAWELALMAGDVERANALLADGPDVPYRAAFIAAWEGDEAAYAQVRAVTDAAPSDGKRLSDAARLADHLGDIESARRYRRLLRIGPHYAPMAFNVGQGQRDVLGDEAVGTGTHYYGTYTYRRNHPLDLLPPDLPGLVLVTNDPGEAEESAG